MNLVTRFGYEYNKITNNRYKIQECEITKDFFYFWGIFSKKSANSILIKIYIIGWVQIVHSTVIIVNKLHMDTDVITRLINLGIVEKSDDGVVTLSNRYMRYLDHVCDMLIHDGYVDRIDDSYSFMLDSNAYAITSWVGTIRENELVEMLNVVMSIWGEMLLW